MNERGGDINHECVKIISYRVMTSTARHSGPYSLRHSYFSTVPMHDARQSLSFAMFSRHGSSLYRTPTRRMNLPRNECQPRPTLATLFQFPHSSMPDHITPLTCIYHRPSVRATNSACPCNPTQRCAGQPTSLADTFVGLILDNQLNEWLHRTRRHVLRLQRVTSSCVTSP